MDRTPLIQGEKMNHSLTKKILLLFILCLLPVATTYAEQVQSNREIVYKMYTGYQTDFSDVQDINAKDAINELNSGRLLFVDVRTTREMAVSMLPGAISKEEFLNNRNLHQGKTIIAYCTIGYRSGLFAAEMEKNGSMVYNLSAGILGWTHEGGKVYDSRGIVKRIHVYGKDWDYAPEGFDTVMFGFFERLLN